MAERKPMTVEDRKKRLIKLIHVGKRELGLDDETYRVLLTNTVKGKDSAGDMGLQELEKVLQAMRDRGFKVRAGGRGSRSQPADPQSSMVVALWLDLHHLGYVQDPSDKALSAFVFRMTKVSALQWLKGDQLSKLIEEMKKWRDRDRVKITRMVSALVAAGRIDGAAMDIDRLCLQVTGKPELNKNAAAAVVAYLEAL